MKFNLSTLKKFGYDLLATKKGKELNIEVKGTSLDEETFYITRREDQESESNKWRLAIVTDVFDKKNISIYNGEEYNSQFKKEAVQIQCKKIP